MRGSFSFETAVVPSLTNANLTVPLFEVRSSPTDFLRFTTISVASVLPNVGGSTLVYLLGLPAAAGVSPKSNSISFLVEDSGDNSATPFATVAVDWAFGPTTPSNYLRRQTVVTEGNGVPNTPPSVAFNFPRGLSILPSSSLAMWLTSTAALNRHYITLELDG